MVWHVIMCVLKIQNSKLKCNSPSLSTEMPITTTNAREFVDSCQRGVQNGAIRLLKKCLRASMRPFREATPSAAFVALCVHAAVASVCTWLTDELNLTDKLDIEFANASIELTCTVLTPQEDAYLLAKRSAASRYLGNGVRISDIDASMCPVLCRDREWSSRLPYYCYHSSVELDKQNRAFLQDLEANCTKECTSTGTIKHRIIIRKPNFAQNWFVRAGTTLAQVDSDRRAKAYREYDPKSIEKLESYTPSTAPDLKRLELEKIEASLDMTRYGSTMKTSGFVSKCFVLPEPKLHPSCARQLTNLTEISIPSVATHSAYSDGELKLESRPFAEHIFSHCPQAVDPCRWPAVSWDIPREPRPLTYLLICLCTLLWVTYASLLWMWTPRIVRAVHKVIVEFSQGMRERAEKFKSDKTLQEGKWAKQKQVWLIRLAEWGESVITFCLQVRILMVKLAVLFRCIDERALINLLRGVDSFEEDEEDDDEEAQLAKAEAERRQQRWDNLVNAIIRAKDTGRENLDLSRLRIEALPKCIGSAPYVIKTLNLSENEIVTLENSPLLDLACLENLFLMDNRLLSLPDMSKLVVLEILDIENNSIGRAPDLFESVKLPQSLQKLYLQKCSLSTIPGFVLELRKLEWLYLCHNQLVDLENLQGLDQMLSLKKLVVSHNKLKCLPMCIGDLPCLEEFHATDNQLARLPDSLCELTRLRHLSCDSNKIVILPDNLGCLNALETIDASHNRLRYLPESIKDITGLKHLVVSDNDIKDLPGWISNMKEVVLLDFSANAIPKSVSIECKKRLKKANPYVVETNFF